MIRKDMSSFAESLLALVEPLGQVAGPGKSYAASAAAGPTPWFSAAWAWWALAGALAVLAVVLLTLRRVGYRRLGRLGQAVLASLLAHVALTAGLSLIVITRPVLSLLAQDDASQHSVDLVIGTEQDIRTQVRYQVSELPVADPSLAALIRAATEPLPTPPAELTELGAPRAEPQRMELRPRPPRAAELPPPAVERVALAPPPAPRPQARPPRPTDPVADVEPPSPIPADDTDPSRLARLSPSPAPRWRERTARPPSAEARAESVLRPAARRPRRLPEPVPLAPRPPDAETPELELDVGAARVARREVPPAAPVVEPSPAPSRRQPQQPPPPSPRAERLVEHRLDANAPPSVSVASPAARPPSRAVEAPAPPRPAEITAPQLTLQQPAPAVRRSVELVAAASVAAPAEPLRPQPVGPLAVRPSPESTAAPQRLPPADPRGASLSAVLAARPRAPRMTGGFEPVRLNLTPAPLRSLTPRKLKVVRPLPPRDPVSRKKRLLATGGSEITEEAVHRGLAYLARSQEPDGRWTFIHQDNELARSPRARHRDDMGLTGLAVLAFLGADHRPDRRGPYRGHVTAGLDYLVGNQDANGDLRGGGDMYSHGIATLALGEAAALTADRAYGDPAIEGARFTLAAQNRLTGGWRYQPGEAGDTSVMGWQVMALHSVSRLGVDIPPRTRRGALRWLARVSRGRQGMLVGYIDANPTRTMTAEGLLVRLLLGETPGPAAVAEATEYLEPPDPMRRDYYLWYYGSLALYQLQDAAWRKWNARVRTLLTSGQVTEGPLAGSWDPAPSAHGAERGGRVYVTALGVLTLETYYRYLPMFRRAD